MPRSTACPNDVPRSRPRTHEKSPTASAAPGRLILVVSPDPTALAVLLDAARRRFQPNPDVEFPVLACTRRGVFGGSELVLNRRQFAEISSSGGFLATWEMHGALAGLPVGARDDLDAGRAVVIGVPSEHVFDRIGIAPHLRPAVRIVRVTAHTDRARATLSPKACFGRMLGPRQSRLARARIQPERSDATVHLGAGIGAAVSSISEAISAVIAARPSTAPMSRSTA